MSDAATSSRRLSPRLRAILASVLMAVTVLAFWGVWDNGFVDYDDNTYVYLNPNVTRGFDWQTIQWAATHVNACHWVPLTWLSHALDCEFFGLQPSGHHVTSLVLHAATVVLLFLLLNELTGSVWRSAIVAALFGVHPLRVESVVWVAERKDVLSGLFFMLTLLAYTRYVQGIPSARAGFPRSRAYGFALVCVACGLMSKPMLVTVPCVLLLLDFWPLQRFDLSTFNRQPSIVLSSLGPLLREKIPFFVLSGIVSLITFLAQEATKGNVAGGAGLPLMPRLANAVLACVNYLGQTFWPVDLAAFYPLQRISIFHWSVVAGCLLLVALTVLAAWSRLARPWMPLGWFWFLGVLVPVSGIVQAGDMIQADRFTYLPSIGLLILLVWEGGKIALSRPLLRWPLQIAAAAVVAACGVLTHRQVAVWRNTETLFTHAAKVTRNNYVALAALADLQLARGQIAEATTNVQNILTIAPGFPRGECLMATLLQMQGRMQEAIPYLERSVGPEVFVPSRARMVLSLLDGGRLPEAEALLEQLLQIMPRNPEVWLMKAALLREQGHTGEAVELFRKVTASYPPKVQDTPLFNFEIAELHGLAGGSSNAVPFYTKALAAQPDFLNALNNYAWLLATDSDAALRNGALALQYSTRACELTQWKQPVFMGTLAAAYAEAGRFSEAVKMAERARDRAQTLGAEEIAKRNAELLELYRHGKSYRE